MLSMNRDNFCYTVLRVKKTAAGRLDSMLYDFSTSGDCPDPTDFFGGDASGTTLLTLRRGPCKLAVWPVLRQ